MVKDKSKRNGAPTNGALLKAASKDLEEGRAGAVEGALADIVAKDDAPAEALRLMGLAILRLGRPEEAAGWLDRAIEKDPSNASCRIARAIIHMAWGAPAAAEAECRAVLELEPGRPDAQAVLAGTLEAQDRLEDAEQAWRDCIATSGTEFRTYLALGDVLRRQGKLQPAVQIYNETVRHWRDEPEAWTALGSAQLAAGDLKGADSACRFAIHLAPGFGPGHIAMGNVLVSKGDLDGAIASRTSSSRAGRRSMPMTWSWSFSTTRRCRMWRSSLSRARPGAKHPSAWRYFPSRRTTAMT
jgi:Tfp pilus assembly protein PilF